MPEQMRRGRHPGWKPTGQSLAASRFPVVRNWVSCGDITTKLDERTGTRSEQVWGALAQLWRATTGVATARLAMESIPLRATKVLSLKNMLLDLE